MTRILIGVSDQNRECKRRGYKNWVQYILKKLAHDVRPKWENPKGHVLAAISKKRWYVKCPSCKVNIGIDEDSALFFCYECLNIANDERPQHIKFPIVKKITELMALRPDYRNRNYLPHKGETLKDIEAENIEYGWLGQICPGCGTMFVPTLGLPYSGLCSHCKDLKEHGLEK